MGKKLIIKGADFSENGFAVTVVKKEITALVDKEGNVVSGLPIASNGVYFFQRLNDGSMGSGTGLAAASTSKKDPILSDFIDVEDYEDAEVTSVCAQGPTGNVAGVAVMFFLNSQRAIIGGLSTGEKSPCENVGASPTLRTFKRNIPVGTKYVVCSVTNNVSDFKLTLSKKVIE